MSLGLQACSWCLATAVCVLAARLHATAAGNGDGVRDWTCLRCWIDAQQFRVVGP